MVEIEVPHKEVSRIYEGFQKLVNEPSERSAIIILSARIESLTEMAASHFMPGVRLSGQARRLDALHGLGVLDDQVHKLLKELAIVRNHFAHSEDDCSLSDSDVKEKVATVLSIGNDLFNSQSSIVAMENNLSQQLTAKGIKTAPGWFTSDLKHLFLISTLTAYYLAALAYAPFTPPKKLDAKKFTVKTIP